MDAGTTAPSGAPSPKASSQRDEVSRQARRLWEQAGRPVGRDEEFRCIAEQFALGADPEASKRGDGYVNAQDLRDATSKKGKPNLP